MSRVTLPRQLNVTLDRTAPLAFTSTPPTAATVGMQLTYDAQNPEEGATGAAYSLTNAPTGVSINATSGVLTWTPTGSQLGTQAFAIVMTDAAGNTRSQDLSIHVAADALMVFRLEVTNTSGTPISSIDVGGDFLLKVYVQDLRAPGVWCVCGVPGCALQPAVRRGQRLAHLRRRISQPARREVWRRPA